MDQLLNIVKQKSFKRGTFTLASGAESEFFFDLKPTMLDPLGATLIGERVTRLAQQFAIDAIGGLAIGAVPIVAVSVARSYRTEMPFRGFYVRKDVKDHGTQVLIEGLDVSNLLVILVEDVTTTGTSLMRAATAVRDAGAQVTHAITIIDRLEGGAEHLATHDITLLSLYTRQNFD